MNDFANFRPEEQNVLFCILARSDLVSVLAGETTRIDQQACSKLINAKNFHSL